MLLVDWRRKKLKKWEANLMAAVAVTTEEKGFGLTVLDIEALVVIVPRLINPVSYEVCSFQKDSSIFMFIDETH